jgi:thiamine pyrophosphate-dependent acetolactate synthase large subunit-like protein
MPHELTAFLARDRVPDRERLQAAVQAGLQADRPSLVHVPVSPDVLTPPREVPATA